MSGAGAGSAFARFGGALVLMFGLVVVANASAPAAGQPRWPVMRTPSPPGPPNGELYGVSCASATDCVAVGSNSSGDGGVIIIEDQARFRRWSKAACATPAECLAPRARRRAADPSEVVIIGGPTTLVEHWNGSGWSFAPAPNVSNGLLNLIAVDCPATNACFAVGDLATITPNTFDIQPVVVRWNGSAWTTLKVPDVAGSISTELHSIDCTSATHCVAVGDYLTGNFRKPKTVHDHGVIAEWNGTAWTIANTPAPTGSSDEFLGDVSCVTGTCVAVGGYLDGSTVHPLTEMSTGSGWTAGSGEIPAGQTGAQFISVACTGVSSCAAVGGAWAGSIDFDTLFDPLAERWNGSTWSTQPVPLPPGADGGGLYSVACAGPSDCSAVGFVVSTGAGDPFDIDEGPLRERWNGSSWSVASGPDPSPLDGLYEVACPATNACFAVGGRGSIEQWNGTTWFVSRFAGRASQSSLADVDCLSPADCFAVGAFRGDGDDQPLVEHWNGSQWQKMTAPAPGSGAGSLTSVSCVSTRDCTAVGSRTTRNGLATLVEHWNGSSWSIVPSPTPRGGIPLLTSVDCKAPGRCVAVGLIFTDSFSERPFSVYSRGGRWALTRLPLPDFAEIAEVTSVSCATATRCFAAGVYLLVTGDRQQIVKSFLAEWNGSRWLRRAGAAIEGNPDQTQLTNVSCASATGCSAFGLYLAGDAQAGPIRIGSFVERWDGKRWKARLSDNLVPFLPDDVSCRSAVSCYAVGSDFGPTGFVPGVAHWNGHRWARVSVSMPPGASRASLTGVDCPTRRVCFAVGSYQNEGGSFTLALRGT